MANIKDFYKAYGDDIKISLTRDERLAKIMQKAKQYDLAFFQNPSLAHHLLCLKLPKISKDINEDLAEVFVSIMDTEKEAQMSED